MKKFAIASIAAIVAAASFASIAEARSHDNHWIKLHTCSKKIFIKKQDGHVKIFKVIRCS